MKKRNLKKVYISVFSIVVAFFISFYFLAGDQLKYRDSRFNISVTDGTTATKEIADGLVVTQKFNNLIDRFNEVSVQCTTFYRKNYGYVYVDVYDGPTLLMHGTFNTSKIEEGQYLTVTSDDYIEGLAGKELSIVVSSTSPSGKGIALLTNSGSTAGTTLKVGSSYMAGSLCFTASGEEYIFTGQWYWVMAAGVTFIIALILCGSYRRFTKHKVSYIANAVFAVEQYKFLISQLVSRDFKTKYKRSILGIFWSFLNPLLTMIVQYIVFSTLFRTDIKNYSVYLLTGIISYSFFNEVTNMCLQSITSNASLIKKVYMPKYILPLSRTLSSSINLGISLIPLLIISLLTGVVLHKSVILMLYFLICLIIFSLGVGMILAALNVFFRDTEFLWSVVGMMWMYATPIFYSPSIIPAKFQFILNFNPLYHFIKNMRMCLIDGISPGPRSYLFCFIFAIGSMLVGSFVFKKTQDKFTLYL